MALSIRTQNLVLGALAALAVGTSAFAVWVVNQPHPSLEDPNRAVEAPAAVTTTPPEPSGDEIRATGVATAEPPVTEPAATTDPPAAEPETTTEPPDQAETTSVTPEGEPSALTPQEWWEELADGEATLLALGDDFSHLRGQWLHQWGELVGEDRPVQIRHWGEDEDSTFNPVEVLAEGEGEALTIWSASRAGATISETADRFAAFDRLSPQPDALLISLGSASEDEDVSAELDRLLDQLHPVPILMVVPPAELYDPEVSQALTGWGAAHAERVTVVDLRENDLSDPSSFDWAVAFRDRLSSTDR